MLRQKMLTKKRSQLEAQRKTLLQTRQHLRATEDELQAQIDSVDAVDSELEAKIESLTQQQTETDDAIADILAQIDEIDDELASLGGGEGRSNEPDEDGQRTRRSVTHRTVTRSFRSRSGCFSSREAMEEFYAQRSVADFVSRVRAMAVESARPGARRVISGAELAIPTEVLDIVRDNLGSYSRLLKHVRLRQLRGKARAMVTGKVPTACGLRPAPVSTSWPSPSAPWSWTATRSAASSPSAAPFWPTPATWIWARKSWRICSAPSPRRWIRPSSLARAAPAKCRSAL